MKILFTPLIISEISNLLAAEPQQIDTERRMRIFGPLSGDFSHLVLVVPESGVVPEVSGMAVPIPESLGRGFLVSTDNFPSHQ